MNKKIILFLIPFFLLYCLSNLKSQETKLIGNFIKLIVSNNDGRFLLYGRNNVADKWIPLLFEDYPFTSYFRFFKNQLQIPFGEGGIGRYSEIKIEDNKIHYFWRNKKIQVEIEYRLVSSSISESCDTLLIDLNIINLANNLFSIEYFACFDTYFGERSKEHFILPGNTILQTESEIPSASTLSHIRSYNKELDIGVSIIFNKERQVSPNRTFFANWKRAERNIGLYNVVEARSFDLKPYSINDSAIFIEYIDQKIYPNRDNRYRFIISMKNNICITEKIKDKIDKIDRIDRYDDLDLINLTLAELLALLDRINQKLESKELLKDDDVELVNKILEEIKKRRGM